MERSQQNPLSLQAGRALRDDRSPYHPASDDQRKAVSEYIVFSEPGIGEAPPAVPVGRATHVGTLHSVLKQNISAPHK